MRYWSIFAVILAALLTTGPAAASYPEKFYHLESSLAPALVPVGLSLHCLMYAEDCRRKGVAPGNMLFAAGKK